MTVMTAIISVMSETAINATQPKTRPRPHIKSLGTTVRKVMVVEKSHVRRVETERTSETRKSESKME